MRHLDLAKASRSFKNNVVATLLALKELPLKTATMIIGGLSAENPRFVRYLSGKTRSPITAGPWTRKGSWRVTTGKFFSHQSVETACATSG